MDRNGSTTAGRERLAAQNLTVAVESDKCRSCGCLHTVVLMIEDQPAAVQGRELARALDAGRAVLRQPETDCRGCEPCPPGEALKILRGL
ncbi:MAG: hypothetical protein FVQ81_16180 [Candidatus Glassbacteria bacterium]|nr:hypothetical protein [Candidatus Glassbacteria bacterium]